MRVNMNEEVRALGSKGSGNKRLDGKIVKRQNLIPVIIKLSM